MPTAERPTAQLSDLIPICSRLPSASVDQLIGATKVISHAGGRMNHRKLVAALRFNDEHTVGVIQFLSLLGLVDSIGSDVVLTVAGNRIASSDISARRRLFADLALRLPIIREVVDALAGQSSRSLSRSQLLSDLGAQSCAADVDHIFGHVVAWGRYAGLFTYDAPSGLVSLLNLPS
jgi:NitT/TauT family transport system ATP-binding protein